MKTHEKKVIHFLEQKPFWNVFERDMDEQTFDYLSVQTKEWNFFYQTKKL